MNTITTKTNHTVLTDNHAFLNLFTFHINNHGYPCTNIRLANGKQTVISLHKMVTGTLNLGYSKVVDHINGDKLDNRRCNLRITTQQGNLMNKRTSNDLPLGVSKQGSKFRSDIYYGGVHEYLGLYETVEEASEAYIIAKSELHHIEEFEQTIFLPDLNLKEIVDWFYSQNIAVDVVFIDKKLRKWKRLRA